MKFLVDGAQSCGVRRRGVTILEILIVLAILIAIGALAAPAMFGVMEERALASAVDAAQQQLVLARAHAQATGRPVEVLFRPEPHRVMVRYFERGERGVEAGEFRAGTLREEGDVFAEDEEESGRGGPQAAARDAVSMEDADALSWRWARQPLPRGITLRREPPVEPGYSGPNQREMRIEGFDGGEPGREEEPARPTRLAVFMPDGSALLARPVWLVNERGRAVQLEVSVWTGLPRVQEWSGGDTGEPENEGDAFQSGEAASSREDGR